MKRHIAFAVVLCSAVAFGPAFAQTEMDRARINYEGAKNALAQGQPDVALAKFEAVMKALGEEPELLTFAAEAALGAKDIDKASEYVTKAFAKADAKFRASPAFQRLIKVAADLESAKVGETADGLPCSTPYAPLAAGLTWVMETYTGSEKTGSITREVIASADGKRFAIKSSLVMLSDSAYNKVTTEPEHPCSAPSRGVDSLRLLFPKDSWTDASTSADGTKMETYNSVSQEMVTVPLGTFRAVRHHAHTVLSTGGDMDADLSFVKGIGLVRSWIGGSRTKREHEFLAVITFFSGKIPSSSYATP